MTQNTALLVIDVQESFRQMDSWSEISDPDIADRISGMVDLARSRDEMVIWILHVEPRSSTVFDPARGHCEFLAGLEPRTGEPIVQKTSVNAFTTTGLAQLLTTHGITRLRVTGIRTEQCCETTARVAADLGYEVDFVVDATATHPLRLWGGGGHLTTEEVKQRTASALEGRFATVLTIADLRVG